MRIRRTLLGLIGAGILLAVLFAIVLEVIHHRVAASVESVGGSISVEPGSPMGNNGILLDAYYCGLLDAADLLRVVRMQRYNWSLQYLSLNEQEISRQLASQIAHLECTSLSIVK